MNKVAFVVSHFGSGSFDLINILNKNPKCNFFSSDMQYTHPEDLGWMFSNAKFRNYSGSIFGDHLLKNISFSCKSLYNYCKFIYVIRSPRFSLEEIYYNHKIKNYLSYYKFRLRRIYEMTKCTPNFLFTTWDNLSNGHDFIKIQNFLELKEPLKKDENMFKISTQNKISEKVILDAENCYEKYFYYLSKLNEKNCTN